MLCECLLNTFTTWNVAENELRIMKNGYSLKCKQRIWFMPSYAKVLNIWLHTKVFLDCPADGATTFAAHLCQFWHRLAWVWLQRPFQPSKEYFGSHSITAGTVSISLNLTLGIKSGNNSINSRFRIASAINNIWNRAPGASHFSYGRSSC